MGQKVHTHFHRRRPCPEDPWPRSPAGTVGSNDPGPPRGLYYLGRVYAQPTPDSVQRGLERTHGRSTGGRSEWSCPSSRLVALLPLWPRAAGELYPQQAAWTAAALLVQRRPQPADGAL